MSYKLQNIKIILSFGRDVIFCFENKIQNMLVIKFLGLNKLACTYNNYTLYIQLKTSSPLHRLKKHYRPNTGLIYVFSYQNLN